MNKASCAFLVTFILSYYIGLISIERNFLFVSRCLLLKERETIDFCIRLANSRFLNYPAGSRSLLLFSRVSGAYLCMLSLAIA